MTAKEYYHNIPVGKRPDIFDFAEIYASLKVAEATKEMYPKAYIEWLLDENWGGAEFYYENGYWKHPTKEGTINYTTDELFEYWTQNIQGK